MEPGSRDLGGTASLQQPRRRGGGWGRSAWFHTPLSPSPTHPAPHRPNLNRGQRTREPTDDVLSGPGRGEGLRRAKSATGGASGTYPAHRQRGLESTPCCVTLSKSHTLSEMLFLQLQSRDHSLYFTEFPWQLRECTHTHNPELLWTQ